MASTLHTVNKSDILLNCLLAIDNEDWLLLQEDGVLALQNPKYTQKIFQKLPLANVFYLDDTKLQQNCLKATRINYQEYVIMTTKVTKIISWF